MRECAGGLEAARNLGQECRPAPDVCPAASGWSCGREAEGDGLLIRRNGGNPGRFQHFGREIGAKKRECWIEFRPLRNERGRRFRSKTWLRSALWRPYSPPRRESHQPTPHWA